MMSYKKTVYVPPLSLCIRPRAGSFGVVKESNLVTIRLSNWIYCREYFHEVSRGVKNMCFYGTPGFAEKTCAFIDKIEKKIKIPRKTVIGPTQLLNIIWIKPSSWWTKTSMRRSFFTILLRAGANYKDDAEDTLYQYHLANNTRYAVKRFLSGYTRYTGRKTGWHRQFAQISKSETHELLIKP